VRLGNLALAGGYDAVFDCVGSPQSIQESLKWTASRGQMVLVGTGHGGRIDLTPLWFGELTVIGAYGRQVEQFDGRAIGTYQLVHEFMRTHKLKTDGLLTHTFKLDEYRGAFELAMDKSAAKAVRVAFDFR
jgi:threonine dehydrogenase-like Zn-dependent dehydrogenase